MEKKRLLPALIVAALAVSGPLASSAQDPPEGIRTGPGETEFSRAKELIGNLLEPDMAEAEKTLSDMKNSRHTEKQAREATRFLAAGRPPATAFPEKSADPQSGEAGLFYFFSFSMPLSSLREAARESAAAEAVMVLRGLAGDDLAETASHVSEVIGETGAQVWIDPVLFECFSVGDVPQLILARGHLPGAGCEGLPHVKVSGDVSLPRALALMEKEDPDAGLFIERLEKSGFYGD